MQRTALIWVVYVQTNSELMLGVTALATQFPSFLFSLWGGVVSDRHNKYKVLLTTQILSLVQASLLAVLVLFGKYTVWEILSLSVLLGIINAFDVPARQGLVYDMVDHKEDLSNAIALNSSMVNLARFIGPPLSGIVLEYLGAGTCFFFNAISFLAVIISLLLMRLNLAVPPKLDKKITTELKEGFTYLKANPSMGYIILFLGTVSLITLPYITLLPVYAKVIFKGNAAIYGYLNGFIGLGAGIGTIFLASLKPGTNLKRVLLITTLLFSTGLILFSHTTNFTLSGIFAVITGFGMMTQVTTSNTILQTSVAPNMRGRVISYFAMAYFGMMPLGSIFIGALSNKIGAPTTILSEGIAGVLIFGIFFYIMRKDVLKVKRDNPL